MRGSSDAVYFSSVPNPDYKDMKLFDLSHKKVVTVCGNLKRYELYTKNDSFFEQAGLNRELALTYFVNAYLRIRCFGINDTEDTILKLYREIKET